MFLTNANRFCVLLSARIHLTSCLRLPLFSFVFLQAGESSGLFKKTISKLSTEYRLQFGWPPTRNKSLRAAGAASGDDTVDQPRKSRSMGALRSARSNVMPTVHKKRTIHEHEGAPNAK